MNQKLLLSVAVVAGTALGACSSSSVTSTPDAGNTHPDAGGTTAYERLGGHVGLLAFVKGEVENKVLQDSNLKTYFFNQVATPIPAGHPSAGQIEECFTRLVATVVGEESYPGAAVVDAANTNTPNFTCRAMAVSHAGLKIGDKTFDAFVGVIAADLMPLVVADGTTLTAGHISQAEFNVLAAGLTGTKTAIVDPTAPAGPAPFMATLTPYERLGSHAGLLAFVKGEVENKVLKDTNLKTYFFNQVATPIPAGHPSAGQIEECFTRLVATVVGAESYPGAAVADAANANTPSFTCRAMAASHAGLKIGDKTFDAFVGVLAADLMPLVVADGTALTAGHISQAEFNTLAAGLTGTKTAIVDPTAPAGPAPYVATLSAYERLGSHAGLMAFVKGEVENKVLKDTNLKTYFFNQVATPIPAGHPSAGQIEECFTRLVATVIGAEAYPGAAVADAANTNTPSFTCRAMAASHAGLKIGDKTFDAFVGVLAADLMPLVVADGTALTMGHISQTEFNVVAKGLTDQKTAIVDATAAAGPAPFPG